MTAQFLISQLTNLIQESKRKNVELRNAAEKALGDLKALPTTSEAQLASDLSRRPSFVRPFLIACGESNGKVTVIAVICLQKLVSAQALPREILRDVLDALDGVTLQAADVQLKILQILPAISQNYRDELKGDLIGKALLLCSKLQGSKVAVIKSTASATLQQLVVAVFDKVVAEDERKDALQDVSPAATVPVAGVEVQLRAAALDAYKIIQDICLLVEGESPHFLRLRNISRIFGLELIEAILADHWEVFLSHPEQTEVLRSRIITLVKNTLSEQSDFPSTVRAMRLISTIMRRHISVLPIECEDILRALLHLLEPDSASWRRALSMEIWKGIYAEPGLLEDIYTRFDEQEGREHIVHEHLTALARISAERPDVIGLGEQSRVFSTNGVSRDHSNEQAVMEAGGLAGMIGGVISSNNEEIQGISVQWSSPRVPCIDQLDKTDPPAIPDAYLYSLNLMCMSSLSDGLAKLILPLTIPNNGRKQKRSKASADEGSSTPKPDGTQNHKAVEEEARPGPGGRPVSRRVTAPPNPLTLGQHPSYAKVKSAAALLDECWPAILASCSTFLYATLDHTLFHNLVRCFQRLAHVAGLLRLETPRDAFLTTLSKSAVPPHKSLTRAPTTPLAQVFKKSDVKSGWPALSPVHQTQMTSSNEAREQAMNFTTPTLNARNLLCLRALLNLGIALGPVLGGAWSSILETWQQADFTLHTSVRDSKSQKSEPSMKPTGQAGNQPEGLYSEVDSEIAAVDAAASRLLESTAELSDEAFVDVLDALGKLVGHGSPSTHHAATVLSSSKPTSPLTSPTDFSQRMNIIYGETASQMQLAQFFLKTIAESARINLSRLTGKEPSVSGWALLIYHLNDLTCSRWYHTSIRMRSAEVLNTLIKEAAISVTEEPRDLCNSVVVRSIEALRAEICGLTEDVEDRSSSTAKVDIEIHRLALDSLNTILENCGEALIAGWGTVFEVINSIFNLASAAPEKEARSEVTISRIKALPSSTLKSSRLIRPAFTSLQLICSDFLSSIPNSCILVLIDTLSRFCSQDDDLNISLTSITLFWNVSAFLQTKQGQAQAEEHDLTVSDEDDLVRHATLEDGHNTELSLWMLLLLRLTDVAINSRPDIRNGAVQSIFRIFDAYGDQLGSETWRSCLRVVIFKLIEENIRHREEIETCSDRSIDQDMKAWDETVVMILKGIAGLFVNQMQVFVQHQDFPESWARLIRYLERILARRRHDLTLAIFTALPQILGNITSAEQVGMSSLHLVWMLWIKHTPVDADVISDLNPDQVLLVAYIRTCKDIHRLIKHTLTDEHIDKILKALYDCVISSEAPAYTADVEKLTPLQSEVFEIIVSFRNDGSKLPSTLVCWLARFIALPIDRIQQSQPNNRSPTFLALASISMSFMQSVLLDYVQLKGLYDQGAFVSALRALGKTINIYDLTVSRPRHNTLRSMAITSSLTILASAIPSLRGLGLEEQVSQQIWYCIIDLGSGLLKGSGHVEDIRGDQLPGQQFDMNAFITFRNLITPILGSPTIADDTRYTYAESLFSNSLIHQPEPSDLPNSRKEILEDLYDIRIGRTYDPPASKRALIAYVCLDELFSLVARHDGSPERIKLAQVAAPFLILRAAITLRGYIADQPLRGRMPQPSSQRRELLYIIQKLLALECETPAIPNTPGAQSEHRKHLHRILPLVSRAVKVAYRDEKVLGELSRVFELVSEEMGVA
ncbi:MAG: hypothetical protein M1816_002002 [Peltula sp. TS41687]|nr:MAG: hypothetical protein M1816_002002 [Peltula sp. TS41687]